MSEWTSLAAAVFQHRYDLTAWTWSSNPEDTYTSGVVMEARLAMTLYPGQQASFELKSGWFGDNTHVGVPLNAGGHSPRALPCISFRGVPDTLGARQLDITNNDDYVDNSKWFRKDWDISALVAAGMSADYAAYLQEAKSLWYQVLTRLDWIPNTIAVAVDRAIGIGFLPQMIDTSIWQQTWGPLPDWLQSPYRQAAWNELRTVLSELNKFVSSSNLLNLRQEAVKLQANTAFWDTVAKYSGVDAIGNAWASLRQKVQQFNTNVALGRDAITRSKALIAKNPTGFTSEQATTVDHLAVKIEENVAGLKSQVPTSILNALSEDGQALGIAAVILVTIGVGVIAAVVTVITTWVVVSEETARQAMNHEQELIKTAEDAANRAFEAEQSYILNRETELKQQLDQGQISPTDYDREMAKLEQRRIAAGLQLAQRREQTKDLAKAHADNLNALRASEVTSGLSQMKGIAMWGVLGLAVIFIAPTLIRRFSK